jgi:flavin reductase (DIM6/NTAB) family NADH-FMN oxidoreductase RutF
VIAAGQENHLHVMTANAVTSVSLNPMLVLFCVGKEARMVEHLKTHTTFSVNILREKQADLSAYFAGMWKGEEPPHFEFVPWNNGSMLAECASAVCCDLHEMLEGGDHWIVLGRVADVYIGDEPVEPLIFHAGKYRQLTPVENG